MANIVGLDVGQGYVRVALLRTALRKSQLVRYAEAKIASADTEELRKQAFSSAVREALAALGAPAERVVAAMPGDAVSVRRVRIPAKAARRIDEILRYELEALVPFDPDESVLDHQPIETAHGELSLLAVVVPKSRVVQRLEELRAAGVEPREIAVGAVALDGLVHLVPALATPGPHVVIDVDATSTDVCILMGGRCHFARTLSVGLADLDAGRTDHLVRGLKQSVAAWRAEGGPAPVSHYLAGELAEREGGAAWLAGLLESPIEAVPLPPAPGADDASRPRFARAVALAARALDRTRHLDLRQGELAAKQTMTALRQHLPLVAICLGVILATFIFSTWARYSVLEGRNEELRAQLEAMTRRELGTAASSPEQALLLLQRGARGTDPMPRFDAYDALAAISDAVPEGVAHDVQQLQIDLNDGEENGAFSMRGSVATVGETEQIERALESSRIVRREGDREVRYQCFHDLELGQTSRTAGDRTAYRIEGTLRCEPEGTTRAGASQTKRGGARRRSG